MHIQKNAQGEDEAVGSIHKEQLKVAGVPVAPYNEQVVVEQSPVTTLGVPPSSEHANQEPAGGAAEQNDDDTLSERNTREELDTEAQKRGLNPEEYSNKRELLDAIEEYDELNG